MDNTISFKYNAVSSFEYADDGHYHLNIPTFYTLDNFANDNIDFIFDTGAYLTVITHQTALLFGFDKLEPLKTNIPLNGFTGGCEGDLKEIPGLVLGGRRLENVKVAIPYIRTKTNILGLNVIENFRYFVDSTSSRIYFTDNEDFKVPKELKCGKIYSISDQYMLPNGTGLFALNSLSNVSIRK